jgi:hypothetical protein
MTGRLAIHTHTHTNNFQKYEELITHCLTARYQGTRLHVRKQASTTYKNSFKYLKQVTQLYHVLLSHDVQLKYNFQQYTFHVFHTSLKYYI